MHILQSSYLSRHGCDRCQDQLTLLKCYSASSNFSFRMSAGAVFSVILAIGLTALFSAVHKIEEGYIGVYYR